MIVQATETFVYQGRVVRRGETFEDSHPLVRDNRDKFAIARPLEDATADPDRMR